MLSLASCAADKVGDSPCPDGTKLQERSVRYSTIRVCARDDGTRHGPYQAVDSSDGALMMTGECREGRRHGEWLGFYDGQNVRTRETYVDGVGEGAFGAYYSSGSIVREGQCVNGQADGVWLGPNDARASYRAGVLVAGKDAGASCTGVAESLCASH